MTSTDGPKDIDPWDVSQGDVVIAAWDEDPSSTSCHCAFRVEVRKETVQEVNEGTIKVIAHDLRADDVVVKAIAREDEGRCHCDRYFLVNRSDGE